MVSMAKAPIYVRTLTAEEEAALRSGLRSREAFTLRRSQIILASAGGKRASQIAAELGCDTDTALNAINAFNRGGLSALAPGSTTPHRIERGFDSAAAEQ
jgi:transposase